MPRARKIVASSDERKRLKSTSFEGHQPLRMHLTGLGIGGAFALRMPGSAIDNGSLMVGQSVGMVEGEEPVARIIANLMAESETAPGRR